MRGLFDSPIVLKRARALGESSFMSAVANARIKKKKARHFSLIFFLAINARASVARARFCCCCCYHVCASISRLHSRRLRFALKMRALRLRLKDSLRSDARATPKKCECARVLIVVFSATLNAEHRRLKQTSSNAHEQPLKLGRPFMRMRALSHLAPRVCKGGRRQRARAPPPPSSRSKKVVVAAAVAAAAVAVAAAAAAADRARWRNFVCSLAFSICLEMAPPFYCCARGPAIVEM